MPSDVTPVPLLFEGLVRANVITPPGWGAYQRDSLDLADRERWDARVESLGGQVATHTIKSHGLAAGRMMPRRQHVTFYLVPEPSEER
jgi:hypothetical protein